MQIVGVSNYARDVRVIQNYKLPQFPRARLIDLKMHFKLQMTIKINRRVFSNDICPNIKGIGRD